MSLIRDMRSLLAVQAIEARVIAERKADVIDKDWIERIRKGWKLWVKQAPRFPGRISHSTTMEYSVVTLAAKNARVYLNQGRAWIRRLREDLLINKGFWTRPGQGSIKDKTIQLMSQAEETISDALSMVGFTEHNMNPEHGYERAEAYSSQEKFNFYLRGIAAAVDDKVKRSDAIVSGKLLRHLSTMVTEYGSVDFGSYEPSVVNVDGVTLIFADTPDDPSRVSAKADDPHAARHPIDRSGYISQCKEALTLLRRRGFGFLWYGNFEVQPQGARPVNPNGAQFSTGATYSRQGDKIVIYSDPAPYLSRLIVHELGHRYYFKFLSRAEQMRFGEWFGQVMASTEYGKSNPEEDFAEVFADYVMGTDLTRDQIDRLKAFLSKGKNDVREATMPELLKDLATLLADR